MRSVDLRLFDKPRTWETDLSGIDTDNIKYFVHTRAAGRLEDLPET